ncbi:hypothetical protein [Streptomyces sp. NPDC006446]|uniref:hypothetical protein n=1 Tax=Streptomyces sp. NPDC006446 TaxID=3154301 RepID=UPI0033AD97FA
MLGLVHVLLPHERVSHANEAGRHLERYPTITITLPWKTLDGSPVTASLIFTGPMGLSLDRNRFNDRAWRPTLRAAGVETGRDSGMRALRHFYASVLLDAGESIKAVTSGGSWVTTIPASRRGRTRT